MKKIMLLLMCLSLLVSVMSCNKKKSARENDSDELTIGAIYLDAQGYYAGVRSGIQTRANDLGESINIIETNARGDVAKESSFINILSVANIDALILSAVSVDGSVRAIERAKEAGIPIVCYNTCVNEVAMKEHVYAYAVADPFEFGRKIGEEAAKYIKAQNIVNPQIGIINCEQYEVCITRREGFENALENSGIDGWKIVSNQEGTALDKAISTTEQMLAANPNIDVLWGESGGASLGAAIAVRKAGYLGNTVVFASDMTTEIARELESYDIMKAVVDISGKKMGSLTMDLALKAVKKEKLDNMIVQAPMELYTSSESAKEWLEMHPDGLP